MSGYDVLGLGCAAIDDLLFIDRFPGPDGKEPVRRRERHCGGLTATALVAAARSGARCAYASRLGDNDASRWVRARLEAEGIDTSHVAIVPDGEPIQATIVVGASGSRTILFSVPPTTGAHPELPAAEVIAGSRVLHIDYFGTTGNLRAIAIARRSGAGVVGDLEDDRDPRFAELLAAVDHPVLSRDFACRLTGAATPDEAATRLWAPGRSAVIVTDGANGCWSVEAGTPPIRHPTFAVTAVDTTGCGDVFHGVYAAALAAGLPLAQRIRRASAAAALKATRPGGQSGIPTAATLDAFLAAH